MAKLYAKVQSDIRAGLGCRGNKNMDAAIMFSFTGGRTPDGGIKITASERGNRFSYKVVKVTKSGDELINTVRFQKEEE